MTKEQFIDERTKIISKMLDNPDKYGMNIDNMTFSDDEMHYIFGHLNMIKEKCYSCGSYGFSIVRDMTSRRICVCGHSWECPK